MSERRLKRSALRDVAGMTRSFHYAAHGALLLRAAEWGANTDYLEHWADLWYFYVSGVFLRSYMHTVADAGLLPQDSNDFEILFESFLLEKAVYELGYELNNRPSWLMIPIRGIQHILKGNV
jgi:maltose alpha-D-glucosyltransferase/alpha-amylase